MFHFPDGIQIRLNGFDIGQMLVPNVQSCSRAHYVTTHSNIDPQTSIYSIFIQSDAKFIGIESKFRIKFFDLRNDSYCTA